MSSLRIVVAGSSGFLGTHLKDELVRRGHAVTALIRQPDVGSGRVDLGSRTPAPSTGQ